MDPKASASDRVCEIVRRRLIGVPVAEIAQDLGISRQYIYNILSRLPKDETASTRAITLPVGKQYNIAVDYLNSFPFPQDVKNRGREKCIMESIALVAEKHHMDKETVYTVLCRITEYHPSVRHFPYYSSIERWKIQKSVSFKEFAAAVGCPQAMLKAILKCWYHMPLDLATRIKSFSGLSVTEIYSDLIEIDRRTCQGERE